MANRQEWIEAYQDSIESGDTDRAERIAASFQEKTGRSITASQESIAENVLDVGGEFASAANRAVMQGLDFLGPGTANAALRLAGSDFQLPTFEGAYAKTPGAAGGFMEPGTMRNVVRGAGGAAPAAAGFYPIAGRNVASPAGALAELTGLGAAKPKPGMAGVLSFESGGPVSVAAGDEVVTASPREIAEEITGMDFTRRATEEAGALADEGSSSVRRFGKRRDPYTGSVVTDEAAVESARQGVPRGIVSTVQAATPETRSKLRSMLDIVEQSKDDARFSITNRPLDVAGESLADRFNVVRGANSSAARRLDDVAQNLRGQQVDASSAFQNFSDSLEQMGVNVARDEDGLIQVGTRGSDISGIDAPTRALQRLFQRIDEIGSPDAYELHRLKRYIDENVSYGRGAEGLTGKVEGIVKNLRRNIDEVLDSQFAEYDRVNSQYAETRDLLDETQRLVASGAGEESVNFEKGLGTLLRRVLSNARSREPMLDLVSRMDSMAQKYARPGSTEIVPYRAVEGALSEAPPASLDDDILTQVLFADELDRLFGTNARTSLLGDTSKAADRAAELVLQEPTIMGVLSDTAKAGMDKIRGINEESAMEALRELLGRN